MGDRSSTPAPSQEPTSPTLRECPACGAGGLKAVLVQPSVPVHTSAVLATREQALAYPTAEIALVVCPACGLLTNGAFDARGHDYSTSYEEVQSFSPRFRAYITDLSRTLVERHGLRGRDVFEIGCGRGDFLLEICAHTGGAGYGVDPSFREQRLEGPAASRVAIERTFFAPGHVPESAAAIVCRHMLEHVHDVRRFLGAVREGFRRAPGAVVVFEVPDALRILRETAFWDVFYEHCSYFTPGSLARAIRASGLAPSELELTFDDQYVLLTESPAETGRRVPLPLEEPPAEVVAGAAAFARRFDETRAFWRELVRAARARGRAVVIWGAGSKGVGFLSALGLRDEVACAVDVNPAKHGLFMPGTGHEIIAPETLPRIGPALVVVMNPAYSDEIGRELRRLGVDAEVRAL